LHRYLWQFDFLWNNRQLNNEERTILAVKAAEGKRLMYKDPVAERFVCALDLRSGKARAPQCCARFR
jgi:hypothetical protein